MKKLILLLLPFYCTAQTDTFFAGDKNNYSLPRVSIINTTSNVVNDYAHYGKYRDTTIGISYTTHIEDTIFLYNHWIYLIIKSEEKKDSIIRNYGVSDCFLYYLIGEEDGIQKVY